MSPGRGTTALSRIHRYTASGGARSSPSSSTDPSGLLNTGLPSSIASPNPSRAWHSRW